MNWLHYLVEANIYLGVFYLCYFLFLNHDTHYLLGRAYLLFSCVVAFVLPVTQLSILKPVEPAIRQVVFTNPVYNNGPVQEITIDEPMRQFTLADGLFYVYIIGAAIALLVLGYRLYRLFLLTRKRPALQGNSYKIVHLYGDNTAFSFFNYLFIGTEVPQADTIIAHELVHIRQKHSADIIFVELLKVISWFNPFVYLLQRSLRTIHEYIADEQTAAKEKDALTYSSFLLNNAYGIQGAPIAHSFFNYNLLKKRIIMLNQKRSGRLARLKYLAAVPLCAGMLCASTLVFSKDYAFIDLAPASKPVHSISIAEPAAGKLKATDHTQQQQQMLPPPAFVKNSFTPLVAYLNRAIVYPKVALAKKMKTSVVVNFKLDDAGKVSDVTSQGDPGNGFFEAVKTSMESYRGTINDKAGSYRLGVKFYILGENNVFFPLPKSLKTANYIGEMQVVGMTAAQRKIYNKPPPPPPAPPKVGVAPPKIKVVKFPPPPVNPPLPPSANNQSAVSSINRELAKTIRYPTSARDHQITGKLFIAFTVKDNKIANVAVTRGVNDALDAEAKRALVDYSPTVNLKAGSYEIPIAFKIAKADGKIEFNALAGTDKGNVGKSVNDKTMLSEVVVMCYL